MEEPNEAKSKGSDLGAAGTGAETVLVGALLLLLPKASNAKGSAAGTGADMTGAAALGGFIKPNPEDSGAGADTAG